jgi:hypothetical protein
MAALSSPPLRRSLRAAARWVAPVQPRRFMLAAGRRMSAVQLSRLDSCLGALEQGRWLGGVPSTVPNLPDRFAVFNEAVLRMRGVEPLYLEFGVYQGRTLRWWTEHVATAAARFVGFDSFEGLPEDWIGHARKGTFHVDHSPDFADPRVSLVPGWFEDTLARWEPPAHDQLVVNLDCDLYSSTTCVLRWLAPHLRPGSLIYFDDLLDRNNQLRALWEWVDDCGSGATPIAMARWGHHMLFEMGTTATRREDLVHQPPGAAEQGDQTPHRRRRRIPQPRSASYASPARSSSKPTTNGKRDCTQFG